ncbi:MAG TPA: hypothetical protein PK317_00270 [Coprothermobacter proteolyticus]|nr:hypothetical protein [Coprothermobacter proteolyticus]
MGFTADTKVLSLHGYKPLSEIKVGDLLRTPLGITRVVDYRVDLKEESFYVTPNFGVVKWKTVLKKDLTWGLVAGKGIKDYYMQFDVLDESWRPDPTSEDLFYFPDSDIVFVDAPETQENVVIETENKIIVTDKCVSGAIMFAATINELPQISKDQLETFYNANSKFIM